MLYGLGPTLWHWRRALTIGTAIFAFIAALGGAIHASGDIEPYAPAHREYVRETVKIADERVLKKQLDIQLEQAQGKREWVEDALTNWQLRLSTTTDLSAKFMMEQRILNLNETLEKLNKQIETLHKERE